MPISVEELRPADIIVSTTNAGISAVIRNAIGSSVSHCMLYVGGSFIIDATEIGVERRRLTDAIGEASLAIALRRRGLTAQQRSAVLQHAEQFRRRPYDTPGAVGAGAYTRRGLALATVGCRIMLPFCPLATASVIDNAKPENADNAFFCSELVARCFELAGAPVVEGPASAATPRHIRVATTLLYIGKIKATPKESPGIAPGSPL
jgi:hypothetical protein